VMISVPDAVDVVRQAGEHGVLVSAVAPDRLRALFHLDVGDSDVARAIDVLAPIVAQQRNPA